MSFLIIGAARTRGATPAAAPMKGFAGRKSDRANPLVPVRISRSLDPRFSTNSHSLPVESLLQMSC